VLFAIIRCYQNSNNTQNQNYELDHSSIVKSKEMAGKTRKHSRKHARRTLRRLPRKVKKGGADSQSLQIPTAAFKSPAAAPLNSDNVMGKIA
jgi:hypothetical protein